jgi:hypothetical protein
VLADTSRRDEQRAVLAGGPAVGPVTSS